MITHNDANSSTNLVLDSNANSGFKLEKISEKLT
jgi:hypothetical protein